MNIKYLNKNALLQRMFMKEKHKMKNFNNGLGQNNTKKITLQMVFYSKSIKRNISAIKKILIDSIRIENLLSDQFIYYYCSFSCSKLILVCT